jgi:hypothetical protein
MTTTTTMKQIMTSLDLGDVAAHLGPIGDEPVPISPSRPTPETREVEATLERVARWRGWGVPAEAVRLVCAGEVLETESILAARELVDEVHRGKVWAAILGPVGCGKTVAAAMWLTEVRSSHHGGRVFIASEVIASLPLGTVWAEERLEALSKAPGLVMDDLGLNDGLDGKLHPSCQRVLRARYDARMPTLITSNGLPDQVRQYLGDMRMTDRWDDVGAYRAVKQRVRRSAGQE